MNYYVRYERIDEDREGQKRELRYVRDIALASGGGALRPHRAELGGLEVSKREY